jgi:membrane protein
MAINADLFDIDGTLVDSNEQRVLAWDEAFRGVGAEFDRHVVHDQIGKSSDMLVQALLPDADKAVQVEVGEKNQANGYKSKLLEIVSPLPRTRDLLVRAHDAGKDVVLATSASKDELGHYLALLGVRELVTATISADDVKHTKPAPDIFAAALKKVAPLEAASVIVVADTPYDREATVKCGIEAIGVRSGKFSDEGLRGAKSIALYDDVAALLADYDQSPLGR